MVTANILFLGSIFSNFTDLAQFLLVTLRFSPSSTCILQLKISNMRPVVVVVVVVAAAVVAAVAAVSMQCPSDAIVYKD